MTQTDKADTACAHGSGHAHAPQHGGSDTSLSSSAHATLHCLTGCIIGEVAGLAIAVTIGLGVIATIALATSLAYVTGFALALAPLMRREGLTLRQALSVIWLGEAVSIAAMEIAMNGADYLAGGMHADSVADPRFWFGVAVAAPAGFLAAWPVNYYLLKRQLKACH